MEDQAAHGLHREVAAQSSAVGEETLRSVAALEARLEPVLGASPVVPLHMSQNRESMKDRIRAEEDFLVNKIAEDEIRAVIAHLQRQDQLLLHILERLERGLTPS